MSTGLVVCAACRREVHQDGPASTWRHCEDKSPRCEGARSAYPSARREIVGRFCERDGPAPDEAPWPIDVVEPVKTITRGDTPTRGPNRQMIFSRSLAVLLAALGRAQAMQRRAPLRLVVGVNGRDPQDVVDSERRRLISAAANGQRHQGTRERARRVGQLAKQEAHRIAREDAFKDSTEAR